MNSFKVMIYRSLLVVIISLKISASFTEFRLGDFQPFAIVIFSKDDFWKFIYFRRRMKVQCTLYTVFLLPAQEVSSLVFTFTRAPTMVLMATQKSLRGISNPGRILVRMGSHLAFVPLTSHCRISILIVQGITALHSVS